MDPAIQMQKLRQTLFQRHFFTVLSTKTSPVKSTITKINFIGHIPQKGGIYFKGQPENY
jgi:hypothetical protein